MKAAARENLKTAAKFTLSMLPFILAGSIFAVLYQFELHDAKVIEEAAASVGGKNILFFLTVLEDVILISVCCFFGRILSQKCGLWKPFVFCKKPLVKTLLYILVFGILFSLDYWTFGAWIPGIQAADKVMLTPDAILAGLIYGGICEEILLRLFFMSLLAFMIWKLFFKKTEAKNVPASVFMIANVISALIFAAGHLPATIAAFGALTPLLVIRCFLLNGGFGLLFGYLYRKKGLIYAMLAHAGVHLVSVLIWTIFI